MPAARLQPSRTSQIVALIRAQLDRPYTPLGDPNAQLRLCAGMKPGSAIRLRSGVIARTRFFDEQILRAVTTGVNQIVICGAGYDDRALRFRTSGVKFFEMDHPATQRDKARRLRDMGADMNGLILVPVDFRQDDAAALLRQAGHIENRPTLFACEGLLVYLELIPVLRLLESLRSIATADSTFAASLAVRRRGVNSVRTLRVANARRQEGATEPWLTMLTPDGYTRVFARAGWRLDSQAGGNPIGMLLVTARPAQFR